MPLPFCPTALTGTCAKAQGQVAIVMITKALFKGIKVAM
jgi:hypothetical protein